jgi:hypothetical protein
MTTDNGNGMKYVGIIVLANILFLTAAMFAVWVGDDLIHPAFNSSSVPVATKF